MGIGRRQMLLGGLSIGVATAGGPRQSLSRKVIELEAFSTYGVVPGGGELDQTATLQDACDRAAQSGIPFFLPAGSYRTGTLELKSGLQIEGMPGKSVLIHNGGGSLLRLNDASDVRLAGLTLLGSEMSLEDGGLLVATSVRNLTLSECRINRSRENGIVLRNVSGRISDCEISFAAQGGLFSDDATGLQISNNYVHDCSNNGIKVWRSEIGEDGTLVTANRVEKIAASAGGSGQNGNGISVFRAGSVLVSGNRINDCAFSAIRVNSGSNCQMIGNSCARLGEVALYAEFSFEGAVIANNLVDNAALGISVTNFNEGGRLAVVLGNIIRNLFFRKDVDSRGIGIGVEADSIVTGNVIEGAPGYGILVGWGRYLRDVSVTDNLIRQAHIGIGVSIDSSAGTALISGNLITGAKDGAIRAMDGPTPIGPDLAKESAEAYKNLAIYTNVAR